MISGKDGNRRHHYGEAAGHRQADDEQDGAESRAETARRLLSDGYLKKLGDVEGRVDVEALLRELAEGVE